MKESVEGTFWPSAAHAPRSDGEGFYITLCAIDDALLEAWTVEFADVDFVAVVRKSIVEMECDAVVSPANSFGFMNGGVDAAYMQRFPGIENSVRSAIECRSEGELLVGASLRVHTNDPLIPELIVAPTMRVPMALPRTTVNPYLATMAALRAAYFCRHVAFPGMGTGYGLVPPGVCAIQMRAAIGVVVGGEPLSFRDEGQAAAHHALMCGLDQSVDLMEFPDAP